MLFYCGKRISACGHQPVWKVDENGKLVERLSPEPSQKLNNHSPDGFNFGYGGSGPALLALAILLDLTGDEKESLYFYQDFKWDYVANWKDQWSISEQEIKDWLVRQKGGVTLFSKN